MHRPYSESREPIYIGFERPVNGLGIAGFIVSLCGLLLTFGLICPVGVALSFFGLFHKAKGFAVAGFLIGILGTSLPLLMGYVVVKSHEVQARQSEANEKTDVALERSLTEIEQFRREHSHVPAGIEGNKMVLKYQDGWGRELRYDVFPRKYVVRSAGPDGEFETPDDRTRQGTVARSEVPGKETREIPLDD